MEPDNMMAIFNLVPSIAAPASATASVVVAGTASLFIAYQITSVVDNGAQAVEESLPVTSNTINAGVGGTSSVTWPAVAGATYYNVYKDNAGAGIYGFVGRAITTSFADNNITPTKSDTPPTGERKAK
jgi:hypothetical protein